MINQDILDGNGYSPDVWIFSISIYTCIIFVVDFKIAIHTKFWTIIHILVIIFTSLLLFIAYVWLSSMYPGFAVYETAFRIFSTADFYLIIFFCVGLLVVVDVLIMLLLEINAGGLVEYLR